MKKNGFTLIELLVTMGIIAVLSGLAVFNFSQARMRARDVQRKSDLSQLQKALELYKNDDNLGRYPMSITDQKTVLIDPGYSKVVFTDPKSEWMAYTYSPTANFKGYTIIACLENKADTTRTQPTITCPAAVNTGVVYTVTNP